MWRKVNKMDKKLAEELRRIAAEIENLFNEGLSDEQIERLETAVECIDYVLEDSIRA